jgi:hypothetical protein
MVSEKAWLEWDRSGSCDEFCLINPTDNKHFSVEQDTKADFRQNFARLENHHLSLVKGQAKKRY